MVLTSVTKTSAIGETCSSAWALGSQRARPLVLLVAFVVTLAACTAGPPAFPTREAAPFREEWIPEDWRAEISPLLPLGVIGADEAQGRSVTAVAKANTARLRYHAAVERGIATSTIDSGVDGLPKLCVALSGGGIRASAVSLGVLRGLYAKGLLGRTSYLSSTSGGAYAAAWLYTASFLDRSGIDPLMSDAGVDFPVLRLDPKSGELLRDEDQGGREAFLGVVRNRYYNRVLSHSDFVKRVSTAGAVTAPLLVLHGLSRRTIGTRQFTPGGLGVVYSRAIRSTFLRDHTLQLSDVGQAQKTYRLPYPVFSGSIALGNRRPCGSKSFGTTFRDAVEITPDRLGNPHLGFTDAHKSLRLAELVTGVAAAPDNPKNELICTVGEALGLDVGLRINGLHLVPSVVVPSAVTAPSAIHSAAAASPDRIAEGVHVSDGGFTDNLALLPTVERMCSTTIVLDAEHDPRLEFESYQKFKAMLLRERNLKISIPAIDAHLRYKAGEVDGSTIAYKNTREAPFSADGLVRSLTGGDISGVVLYDQEQKRAVPVSLDVIYLKLGLDNQKLGVYDRTVRWKYSIDADDNKFEADNKFMKCINEGGLFERCPFPQESTFKQWYSVFEFMAYVTLGEHLAQQLPEWK